ncbi:MAG: alpha/beta fold hydrolase [Bacillota bacterium]
MFLKQEDGYKIYIRNWEVNNPKHILIIVHGMGENSKRYEEFANFLNNKDILVISYDQRGHGKSIKNKFGLIDPQNKSFKILTKDLKLVYDFIDKKYPNIDKFILGHSFGSFVLRYFLKEYSNVNIKGALISGTCNPHKFQILFGYTISKVISFFKGPVYKSKFVYYITFKKFNEKFKNKKVKSWLTSDQKKLDEFKEFDNYNKILPINFFVVLFKGLANITKEEYFKINYPLYIFGGKNDPLSNFSKQVNKLINKYNKYVKVNSKIYKNGRHEMLNEKKRLKVFNDIYYWINSF